MLGKVQVLSFSVSVTGVNSKWTSGAMEVLCWLPFPSRTRLKGSLVRERFSAGVTASIARCCCSQPGNESSVAP